VDFKNAVIIMTSNIASTLIHEAMNGRGAGRSNVSAPVITEGLKRQIHETLLQHFRPEFLNRIDEIVIFDALGKEEIEKIIDLQLARLRHILAERKIQIELTDKARELLFEQGYDPQFGARPLKRAIQRLIQDPLAMKLLDGDVLAGDTVTVDADPKKGVMRFERATAKAARR
jgi:ATP-dependent Clp protease ATP-binding subunit ClpB